MFEKSTDLYRIMSKVYKRESRIKSKKLELSADVVEFIPHAYGVTYAATITALFTVYHEERPIMLLPVFNHVHTSVRGLIVAPVQFEGGSPDGRYGITRWTCTPFAYSEDVKKDLIDMMSHDSYRSYRAPQLDEDQIKIILTLDSGRMPESINGNCKLFKTVNTFLRKFVNYNYTNILMYMEKDISVRFKDVPVKPVDIEFEV